MGRGNLEIQGVAEQSLGVRANVDRGRTQKVHRVQRFAFLLVYSGMIGAVPRTTVLFTATTTQFT